MNAILATPMPIRLGALFVLGAFLSAAVSLWADRLERTPRRSPWFVRPVLLGLLGGAGLAALYWWEIGCQGLLPAGAAVRNLANVQLVLHGQYAAHVVLGMLMLAASVVDVDEKIIPDAVTVPGTLIGLLLAAAYPWTMLPDLAVPAGAVIPPAFWQQVTIHNWLFFLQLASPNRMPASLGPMPLVGPLLLALACWWAWCLALLPRSWYSRHGWRRAWQLMCARLVRQRATYAILAMGLLGSAAVAGVWRHGAREWEGLLSALAGVAVGGGIIWTVRIVGTAALKREAMGFGDVTLVAMMGAFLGWQSCLVIFFLAPFAGLVVGLFQVILFRETEIPYGPFLCLAALALIVRWIAIWDWIAPACAVGWLVPAAMVFCMILLAVLLALWKLVLGIFR